MGVDLGQVGRDGRRRFINEVLGTLADHQEELRREIEREAAAMAVMA